MSPSVPFQLTKCDEMSSKANFQWTKHNKMSSRLPSSGPSVVKCPLEWPNAFCWCTFCLFTAPVSPIICWNSCEKLVSHLHVLIDVEMIQRSLSHSGGNKVNYQCLMQFQIYAKHLSNFCLVERKLHCHDKCWILVNQPVRCLSTYFYIFRQSHCCQKDSEYLQLCFLLSESAYWFKKDEMPTIDWSVQLCFIFHLLFLSKYFLNYILLLAHQVRQFMDICDVHKQTL